jgi:hypothetical protein
MNAQAQQLLKKRPGNKDDYRDRITYCDITSSAVRDAL